MISNTLKFKSGNRIGSNPVLSELIRSFELQIPVQGSLTPKWDLSWVLICLQKPHMNLYTRLPNFTLRLNQPFCVACVAWQTHRDHVILPHHRCRRHTFHFRSITFEGMYGFHSNFAELYITIKYRSGLILVIIRQILAVMALFQLSFCCSSPLNNF